MSMTIRTANTVGVDSLTIAETREMLIIALDGLTRLREEMRLPAHSGRELLLVICDDLDELAAKAAERRRE